MSVTNSRQPQSLATRLYRFCDSFATEFSSFFWLYTASLCETKQDQSVLPAATLRGSVTSKNMDRVLGGCDCPRG